MAVLAAGMIVLCVLSMQAEAKRTFAIGGMLLIALAIRPGSSRRTAPFSIACCPRTSSPMLRPRVTAAAIQRSANWWAFGLGMGSRNDERLHHSKRSDASSVDTCSSPTSTRRGNSRSGPVFDAGMHAARPGHSSGSACREHRREIRVHRHRCRTERATSLVLVFSKVPLTMPLGQFFWLFRARSRFPMRGS